MACAALEWALGGLTHVAVVDHAVAGAGAQDVCVPGECTYPLSVCLTVGALELECVGVIYVNAAGERADSKCGTLVTALLVDDTSDEKSQCAPFGPTIPN
jgi:hypothetical protein